MIYVEIWHDDMPKHPIMSALDNLKNSLTSDFYPKQIEPLTPPNSLQRVIKNRHSDYRLFYKDKVKFIIWLCATPRLSKDIRDELQAFLTDTQKLVIYFLTSQQDTETAVFLRSLPRLIYRNVNWDDANPLKAHFIELTDYMDTAQTDERGFLNQFITTLPNEISTRPNIAPITPPTGKTSAPSSGKETLVNHNPDTPEKRPHDTTIPRRPILKSPISDKIKLRPATFNNIAAPKDDPFYYEENEDGYALGVVMNGVQWALGGASRRGNSHRNKGTPRDDAMDFRTSGPWNVIAVADGAGSAKLSRVTANQSVVVACNVISDYAHQAHLNDIEHTQNLMKKALTKAVHEVHDIQTDFTQQQKLDKRDTYCTLLILIHQPLPTGGCVFATFQAGDGYMMGMTTERTTRIAKGDHGAEAGTSQFVLSFNKAELEQRITTYATDKHIHTFMLVTDGIEDDLKVSHEEYQQGRTIDDKATRFAGGVRDILRRYPIEYWGKLLSKEIDYDITGSNDDRTIVMLTTLPDRKTPFHG